LVTVSQGDPLDQLYRAREDGGMKKLILILLFGASAACTTQAHDPVQPPVKDGAPPVVALQPGATVSEIKRLIGTPTCSDNAQCRSLPVGALACGGPQEYLPYSTAKTDEKALLALAERSKTERQAEIQRTGEMSICIHRPDPGAVCVAGACQLGSPAA
jgi:hypothetical protein